MTCEICGCSFVDVESEDYTEVFTTGLCCECILEENWGNRMKFKIFNFCKHDYIAMVHVGGDIQNTVFKCSKCSKKYVMSHKEVMKRSKWGNRMKEPLLEVVKRKIKQLLCFKHDWYYWVDKKHKSCKRCDVTKEVIEWKSTKILKLGIWLN